MKKLLAVLCLLGGPAFAQTTPNMPYLGTTSQNAYTWTPLGCQTILPVASTALTIPSGGPTLISLSVEGQAIRIRDDGTAPTAAVGLNLPVGGPWPYSSSLSALRMIQTASAATVTVCYYR